MKELALQTSTNQQEIENIKQIMDDAGVMDTASARRAMNNLKKKDMALYKYAISFKCKFGDLLSNSPSFPPPPYLIQAAYAALSSGLIQADINNNLTTAEKVKRYGTQGVLKLAGAIPVVGGIFNLIAGTVAGIQD